MIYDTIMRKLKLPRIAVLAALLASPSFAGDFKQAVETQQAALDLLRKDKAVLEEIIKEFTTRLSLYTAGKPYTQHRSEQPVSVSER